MKLIVSKVRSVMKAVFEACDSGSSGSGKTMYLQKIDTIFATMVGGIQVINEHSISRSFTVQDGPLALKKTCTRHVSNV